VDKSKPSVFFDGASYNGGTSCRIGFLLYISNIHYVFGKANLGAGLNNYGEFKAFLLFLKLALNKGQNRLQVLGVSLLT